MTATTKAAHTPGRQFLLVKPNYRFAGLARKEWQIFTFISIEGFPERGRYGSQSRMIFSGTHDECVSVLEGCSYMLREYRTGREICRGHYTPAGMFTVAKVAAIAKATGAA